MIESASSVYLVSFSRELKVRAFDNSIDRASFLAEPAVDAFGHVNIVSARQNKI